MNAADIQKFLKASPFKPFKLMTSRTGSVDVTDPSAVLLTHEAIHLGQNRDSAGVFAEVRTVALAQVSSVG